MRGRVEARAELVARGRPLPVVVLLHGYKASFLWSFLPELSHRLAAAGVAAVSFNVSGSGIGPDLVSFTEREAFARNTYARELEDLERVRAWVGDRPLGWLDPDRVGLFGHSRGAGLALVHASERRDYRGLVAWSAVSRVARFGEATQRAWREKGVVWMDVPMTGDRLALRPDVWEDAQRNRERYDVLAACARIRTPSLLVHAAQDRSVSRAELDALLAAFPPGAARSLVVEGVGHGFGAGHPLERVEAPLERALGATVDALLGWLHG